MSGQCFGSNICCGPFGCLMGTAETLRCQQEGLFNEPEPCIAGVQNCRKNTGRCAAEGICCSQGIYCLNTIISSRLILHVSEACHFDSSCMEDKLKENQRIPIESLYNLYRIHNQIEYGNE